MPHSNFKEISYPLNSEVRKCPCFKAFDHTSERDLGIKLRMHGKFCPNPAEGSKKVRVPKKAMILREVQHDVAERIKRVHKHH